MYDVAQLAGVSHQTVSRVLNGAGGVRPTTTERVLEAIRELGFRPNRAARTLATRRSRAIGVLAPASAEFGPMSSLHAIEHATRDAGYRPLITSAPADPVAIRESLEFLLDQSIEALVVIAPYASMLGELMLGDELPLVVLNTGETPTGTAVTVDQAAGARLLARHLLDLGHRRIQQVAGPMDFFDAVVRRRAVDDLLRAEGLPVLPALSGDWTADSGYAAAAALDPTATAIVCGNDQMALGLIHGLSDLGRRVPAEVSVVGFDDIPESAHSLPPLTTVHQDFAEVGRRAVALLVGRLDGTAAEGVDPSVEPWLVVRHSTAPPRSEGAASAAGM